MSRLGPSLAITALGVAGGGGAAFSPTSLFGSGESGYIYDLSALSSLSQTAAGPSGNVGVGDPIGRVNDLSGNGVHLLADNDASRGVLERDGSFYRLKADGVTDKYQGSYGSTISQPITLVVGGWCEDHFREGVSGSRVLLQTRATDNVIILFAGAVFSTAYTVIPNVNHVYAAVYNGASSQIYADGTLLATGNAGSSGTNIFRYFAEITGVSREGALYRAVEINRVLTAQELADVQAWCAAATGVTLS